MDLKTYQQEVQRTLPDLGSQELNIAHMIMGMNSEFSELIDATDDVNRAEELTDIAWYLANYATMKELDAWRVYEFDGHGFNYIQPEDDYIIRLQVAISLLTDIEKKAMAYKKPYTREAYLEAITEVFRRLNDCYAFYGIIPEDAMQKNIDKLRARYPEKFDQEQAVNRNLELEREKLEGK